MSMQIKTVVSHDVDIFDVAVNRLLNEGWTLKERKLVQTPAGTKDYVYAELVKVDTAAEPAPITWQQAVETIKGICRSRKDCTDKDGLPDCPMFHYCKSISYWDNPNEWPEVPHD